MKTSLLAALAFAGLLLASSFAPQPVGAATQADEGGDRPAAADLAQRVADLEQRVQELERAHQADAARLDGVLRFLEAQRKAARSLDGALERVRELGFTKGINFGSRELLLDALHARQKALEAPLPKASAPAPSSKRR